MMDFTTADNLKIHFRSVGDPGDPALVLIHGIGADHKMWLPQTKSLPAAGFHVLIPDLRGHGKSQVPPDFRIRDCARDILSLLDRLDISRANLAGVSMGGMVVQQFAVDYPDRVLSLVIADSLSGVRTAQESFNAGLAALLLKIFPPGFQARLIRSTYKRMGHKEVGEYLANRLLVMDPAWLLKARLEVNRFDVFNELPKITAPTLVLVGDGFGKLAVNMARATADSIPKAHFQILSGGGDPSNLLVPEAFDNALVDFLRGR
ncbi:MAG: alpha/beta fold hydrolase [Anaerolineales bacterium]